MPENVEVVRRVIDAINRADFEAVVASFSADFEFDFSNSRGPMSGVYHGRDGAKDFLTSFFEPFAAVEFVAGEVVPLEDGRVLTVTPVRARGQESGIETAATGASIWTIREGEVVAITLYQSKDEALAAASAER